MAKNNTVFKRASETEAGAIFANSRFKFIMPLKNVMEWEILDTPIYAEGLKDWIIAGRHLPTGIRQHAIKGEVPEATVWQNVEIFGSDILSNTESNYQEVCV